MWNGLNLQHQPRTRVCTAHWVSREAAGRQVARIVFQRDVGHVEPLTEKTFFFPSVDTGSFLLQCPSADFQRPLLGLSALPAAGEGSSACLHGLPVAWNEHPLGQPLIVTVGSKWIKHPNSLPPGWNYTDTFSPCLHVGLRSRHPHLQLPG